MTVYFNGEPIEVTVEVIYDGCPQTKKYDS